MRFTVAFIVAVILAACALQQSTSERAFVARDSRSRAAQVVLDAAAIMQGMAQARQSDERVARATRGMGAEPAGTQ